MRAGVTAAARLVSKKECLPPPSSAHPKGTWTVGVQAISEAGRKKPNKQTLMLMPPLADVVWKRVPTELLGLQLRRLKCLLRAAGTAADFNDGEWSGSQGIQSHPHPCCTPPLKPQLRLSACLCLSAIFPGGCTGLPMLPVEGWCETHFINVRAAP